MLKGSFQRFLNKKWGACLTPLDSLMFLLSMFSSFLFSSSFSGFSPVLGGYFVLLMTASSGIFKYFKIRELLVLIISETSKKWSFL